VRLNIKIIYVNLLKNLKNRQEEFVVN